MDADGSAWPMSRRGQFIGPSLVVVDLPLLLLQSHVRVTVLSVFTGVPARCIRL